MTEDDDDVRDPLQKARLVARSIPTGAPVFAVEARKAKVQVELADALCTAVDRLVASSNNNTETMSKLTEKYVSLTDSNVRLQRWIVRLTFVVVGVALIQVGVQLWSALRPTPAPQVLVQPVPVQLTVAPVPAVPATPPPPKR